MKKSKSKVPTTADYPVLVAWLNKHNARCHWQASHGEMAHAVTAIEGWLVNGHIVIVEVYSEGRGWNIYTTSDDNRIDVSLLDAELRIGLP